MKDLTDIVIGGLASLAGFLGRAGGRAVFLFVAGNMYGQVPLGELAYTALWIEAGAAAAVFGQKRTLLPALANSEGAPDKTAATMKTAFLLSLSLGILLAILLGFGLWNVLELPNAFAWAPLIAFIIPVNAVVDICDTATCYRRKVRYAVLSRSVAEPWTLAVVALGLSVLDTPGGLILAYGSGLLAALAVSGYGFARHFDVLRVLKARIDAHGMGSYLKFCAPTALSEAAEILYRRVDVFFVWQFAGPALSGVYYAAQQIATYVAKSRLVLTPILAPVVSQGLAKGKRQEAADQLAQASRWIMTVVLYLIVILAAYGAELLEFIGPGLAVGAGILVVLIVAEGLDATLANAAFPLIFENPTRNMQLVLTGFLLHLAASTLLTPVLGGYGPSLSLLFSFLTLNVLRLLFVRKEHGTQIVGVEFIKPLAAAALTASVVLPVSDAFTSAGVIPLIILLALVLYVAILGTLGVAENDRRLWQHLRESNSDKQSASL